MAVSSLQPLAEPAHAVVPEPPLVTGDTAQGVTHGAQTTSYFHQAHPEEEQGGVGESVSRIFTYTII